MNPRISRNPIRHAQHVGEIRDIALQLWEHNIELAREVEQLAAKVKRLQAVMDAADAFLAEPPICLKDDVPFNQYTTAGECRALSKAYREVVEAEEEKN